MTPKEWQSRIRLAKDEEAVLALAREYAESLPAERLDRLPPGCRPGPFAERDDVAAFNVHLAREELMFEGPEEDVAMLREMLLVMSEAALRLAQLSYDARLLRPPS